MNCPVCGKPAEAAYRPFCSRRCADVDLGRWFNEDYRIPAPEAEEEADDGPDDDTETRADEGVDRSGDAAGNPRGGLAHRDAGGGAAGGLARTSNL